MLAIPTESYLCGKRFDKVPDHISVLPWFDLTDIRGDFMRHAAQICTEQDSFEVYPGEDMIVGGTGFEKPAQQLISPELKQLHGILFQTAVDLGIVFSHPEWLGASYTPHLTRAHIPGAMAVSHLTVIDNHQVDGRDRGVKTITQKLALGQTT